MAELSLIHRRAGQRTVPLRCHGTATVRGLRDVPRSALQEGRFGRLFRRLSPFEPTDEALASLAATMVEPNPEDEEEGDGENQANDPSNNRHIPAGFTYFGQFVDHDLTFDPNSKLERENDPNALRNFRTPRFDLDALYAAGPADTPFLYEEDGIHLLVGTNGWEEDLPRNSAGRALIGDPRNDENLILSQLTLAFLQFHNRVVDELQSEGISAARLFEEAQRIVRWHYQWAVVHDFLKRIVGRGVVDDILRFDTYPVAVRTGTRCGKVFRPHLEFFHWKNQPFMPVEFAVAAYRFGHSMVRGEYTLNGTDREARDVPIFSEDEPDLRGFRPLPPGFGIEWNRFFDLPSSSDERLELTRNIDTHLAHGLSVLPQSVIGPGQIIHALAHRNLLRGKALGLPSGQAVARAMGIPEDLVLNETALAFEDPDLAAFAGETPLWYYILKEAEVRMDGKKLGPVGGRIVAEVFVGLLAGDPLSYLNLQPGWKPEGGRFGAPADGTFGLADLVQFATGQV